MVLAKFVLKKKNLLIHWNGREYLEFLDPILDKIHLKYNIYLIVNDLFSPKDLISKLQKKQELKIIKSYYIGPNRHHIFVNNFIDIFKHHKLMKQFQKKISKLNFDYYMTTNTFDTFEKYIINILTKKTNIIIIAKAITFLFERREKQIKEILKDLNIVDNSNFILSKNNNKLDYKYYLKKISFKLIFSISSKFNK